MKNLIIFFVLLLPISNILAQGGIPFGDKIDEADLKMTVYTADSNAHAVVLHDYQKIIGEPAEGISTAMSYYRHVRIKILDPSAFDLATVTLNYSKRSIHMVGGIKAQTINWENGKMIKTPVAEEDIFEEKISKKRKSKKFTFPNLKVGSIIEYEYYRYNSYPYVIYHYFQRDIPVRSSEVELLLPDYLQYHFDFNQTPLPILVNKQSRISIKDRPGIKYHCVMKDLPALKDETYVNNIRNYQAALRMFIAKHTLMFNSTIISNWKGLTTRYLRENGTCFNSKGNSRTAYKANQALIKGNLSPKEKMIQLYEHISNHIRWNENYTQEPRELNLNKIYKNKVGSSSEINLLLLALLKRADITAYPILVSTRDNGKVNRGIPFLYQFDHVIIKAEIDKKSYFLDATNPARPYNLLSFQDLIPQGWQLDDEGGKWLDLPKFKSRHIIVPTFELHADGTATGKVNMAFEDFIGHSVRQDIEEAQEKDKNYIQEELEGELSDVEITNFNIKNLEEKHKRLTLNFEITSSSFANVSNDLIYFSPVWMTKFKENPFKSETRSVPVDLGYNLEEHYIMKLKIPEGYAVEDLPESTKINLPEKAGSFTFMVQKNSEKELNIVSRLQINRPVFSVHYYGALRKFFDMVAEKQSEQIVLKKVP